MKKRLVFNLKDREHYFDSLKKLHGGSPDAECEKEKDRQEADPGLKDANPDPKRVSGM